MARKKSQPKDEAEVQKTPEQKFIELTTPRVKKIIKTLRQIEKTVSGRYNKMSQEQITTIVSMVQHELDSLQSVFDSRSKTGKVDDIEVNL
jgi:aminoglycoside phosphotransferase family enzyme